MIPFFRPSLEKLADNRFFDEIDQAGIYSNFGPLEQKFRSALDQHFHSESAVTAFSNATLALIAALAELNLPKNSKVLCPSFTFAATAQAIQILGLKVVFADVCKKTMALTPHIAHTFDDIAAIITVCPFGAPLDHKAWEAFQNQTNIPVIIDAAAAFANIQVSKIPQIVSLHATKIFSSTEGGFILCDDAQKNQFYRQFSNFGFGGNAREAQHIAINAKMSEVTAAIGLQNYQHWPKHKERYQVLALKFKECLEDIDHIHFMDGFGTEWISASCVLKVDDGKANNLISWLEHKGIEARRWWHKPCHEMPAFAVNLNHLEITAHLHESTLAIPFHLHLTDHEIETIIDELKAGIDKFFPKPFITNFKSTDRVMNI